MTSIGRAGTEKGGEGECTHVVPPVYVYKHKHLSRAFLAVVKAPKVEDGDGLVPFPMNMTKRV